MRRVFHILAIIIIAALSLFESKLLSTNQRTLTSDHSVTLAATYGGKPINAVGFAESEVGEEEAELN